jgi:hypothetical protein
MRFLHEDREFEDLLRAVAQQHPQRIGVALIEKDYWVTHALWALQQQGFELWFKGGTSWDLRAVPRSDDPGFLPTSAPRWEPTIEAYRAIASLHWGDRRSLAESCSTIRGWLDSL